MHLFLQRDLGSTKSLKREADSLSTTAEGSASRFSGVPECICSSDASAVGEAAFVSRCVRNETKGRLTSVQRRQRE